MNIYEGKFQVIKPPSITGSQCELKNGSNHLISASGTLGHNKTVKLNNIENNKAEVSDYSLPDSNSNISYRIIENTFNLDYEYLQKKYICVFGGGGGLAPFPYIYTSVGINTKYLNLGVNGLFGLVVDNASYSGEGIWDVNTFAGSWSERSEINESNVEIFHSYLSSNIFGTIYYKGFGLTYSGYITYPMGLLNTLDANVTNNGGFESNESFDISIKFPSIIMQEVYISYAYNSKYVGAIGIGQITSSSFKEDLLTFNAKVICIIN